MNTILISLAVSLCAVLAHAEKGLVRNPGTIVYASIESPTSLDPAVPYDAMSPGLILDIYDTLLFFEGSTNDRIVPRLATEVPSRENGLITMDGKTYTFPIRKGVMFHDGTWMTPQDVKYSLMRFLLTDPAAGPASLLLEPILGVSSTRDASGRIQIRFEDVDRAIEARGDNVVIHLKRPFAPFLAIMARWSYVTSRAWAAAHGCWDGTAGAWQQFNNPDVEHTCLFSQDAGAGPFQIERWDRQTHRVYLKRFDRYWQKPAEMERVVNIVIPEFETRRLMLQAGDADIIDVPRPFVEQTKTLPGVVVQDRLPRLQADPALFFTFHINPAGNPDIGSGKLDGDGIPPDFFTDKEVRLGFAYALDVDAFMRDTMKGSARRARGPVPPGVPGYNPQGPYYPFDLREASNHLRRAWGGQVWEKGFRFTITYNVGSEVRQAPCQILKKNIESLNPKFRIDLRGVEWGPFVDKAQRHLMPLFARGWTADYPDAHDFVFPFYDSHGRYALAQGFADPELDAMIERALTILDPRERERLYWKIQQRGYEDVPDLLTVHPAGAYAMRSWIEGFYDNAVFMAPYFYTMSK